MRQGLAARTVLNISETAPGLAEATRWQMHLLQEQRNHRALRNSPDMDYSKLFASPATSRQVEDASTTGIEVSPCVIADLHPSFCVAYTG